MPRSKSQTLFRCMLAFGCIASFLVGLAYVLLIHFVGFSSTLGLDRVNSLNNTFVSLICLISFGLILSCAGLIGVCFLSKKILIVYEVLSLILLATHFTIFITLLVQWPKVNSDYEQMLNETMYTININNTKYGTIECDRMRHLSNVVTLAVV
jgi:hypothetical protein